MVLSTHIPLFLVWIALVVPDLADGSIKVRGQGQVTQATEPLQFYLVATSIVAIAVFFAIRIMQAGFALADKRGG